MVTKVLGTWFRAWGTWFIVARVSGFESMGYMLSEVLAY